ncbi:flavin reductase family protein [Phyllobacterium sp. P30BS-XVII]|uniref:flavin reductase family protein n=1 Tax=Phyllobacterium sp. P30BS-XVII TaxID=2587046 RepID=UPI000DD5903B|nr:flavin reductase family protein [Phyllobacterium sp. P30BS-XVII]MBA8902841.1 flavin reductase (DIM6/NTAB) family NADH-FMN oxidoreductase RutF [Phyllobacterium sp. P30BS-XVII]
MFYKFDDGHGLPHDPLKAIVAPRPIGWISSRSVDGRVNLAPYSFFNMISTKPCLIMFSSEGRKDSVTFIEETREFAANLVSANLSVAMNKTSVNAPRGISEFEYAGLHAADCNLIGAPRVAEAFATLECVVTDIQHPKDRHGNPVQAIMVTGEVIGVHINEAILKDGLVDMTKAQPVSRLGYMDFATVSETFQMFRPKWEE